MLRRWLLMAASMGIGSLVLGPAAGADPLADRLIEKARLFPAKTLTADLASTLKAGERKQEITGKVRLMRPNHGRVELSMGGSTQTFAADGKSVYIIMAEAQRYLKLDEGAQLGKELTGMAPPVEAFLNPSAYYSEWKETERAPARTVTGRKYEVVRFKTGPQSMAGTAYFEPSGLLVGVELAFDRGGLKGTQSTWLRNVKLNAPLKAAEFAFKAPEGYNVVERPNFEKSLLPVGKTAPDFLLPQPGGLGNLALSTAGKEKKAVLINFWFYG